MEQDVMKVRKSTVHILVVMGLMFSLGYLTAFMITDQPEAILSFPEPNGEDGLQLHNSNPPDLLDSDTSLGSESAKVTITEFSDIQCPFCRQLHNTIMGNIEPYITDGSVRLVFKHFPLRGIHPNAQLASESSECAGMQGKFWEYLSVLLDKQSDWSSMSNQDALIMFILIADQLKLDTLDFSSCMSEGMTKAKVDADYEDAMELNIRSTPTMYINGKEITGAVSWETIREEIEGSL